ncbi:MAG TPA: hypothetical protein VJM08_06085, partial [Anaerolineales bacterium]|nr:hypothetical protein [Anaerolineales bacterium]
MLFKYRKTYILKFALILALLGGLFEMKPAQASAELAIESTSQESFFNPDGTLNLDGDFKGTLDLEGWEVNMDSQKGPVFSRSDDSSLPASQVVGNWENLGGGVPMSFNDTVQAVAVMNGDIIVGGTFTNLADNPEIDYIARWDGVHWSPVGSNGAGNGSLNNAVYALAVDGSGKLYAGGAFFDVNNNGVVLGAADRIAKWDALTGNWSALGSNGAGNGSLNSDSVFALAVDGNGNLYASGHISNVNNNGVVLNTADYVAKWDGTNWSPLGNNGAGNGSLNNYVYALAVDSSGNLYAGGLFTDVNNKGTVLGAADYVAKWDALTGNWSALGNNGAGNGSINYYVYALAVDGSGNLYVGGIFGNVNNNGVVLGAANFLAKWNGTSWSALGNNGSGGSSIFGSVRTLEVDTNGNLYVGGSFTDVNNKGTVLGAADYVAKWDGTNWSALGNNGAGNGSLNDWVWALEVDGNGNLYVGGDFTSVYNGTNIINSPYLSAWNESTSSWFFPTDGTLQGAANKNISAVVADGNGNVYVGGEFINLNGIDMADYIAKWDGTSWSALSSNGAGNGSLNNPVSALAVNGSGMLYVGGSFSDVNNNGMVLGTADYIAKWD